MITCPEPYRRSAHAPDRRKGSLEGKAGAESHRGPSHGESNPHAVPGRYPRLPDRPAEEHRIGHAFEEALPFTALLVVFFAIVAVIHEQHLFSPVIDWVMTFEGKTQEALFYGANGLLSMISDNVFVATVYIGEVAQMFEHGAITREQFEALAVAINTGTNIPSVATPNGQAAFLFLLTSALAPQIRLSYGRMVVMAFPYMVTMSLTGLAALWYLG